MYIHIHTHRNMYTHAQRHMYTHTHMYIHADTCTDTHMYIHTDTPPPIKCCSTSLFTHRSGYCI
ncbi:unnamed protein product [Staurois parvus]|uniref:Uncharacterized protein n=1 Tax=Staurois parvus TaxID=386267 RepID=A0ABN9C9R1_9NEOB|nr:unnamed protein product [Staurois parvus]